MDEKLKSKVLSQMKRYQYAPITGQWGKVDTLEARYFVSTENATKVIAVVDASTELLSIWKCEKFRKIVG